MHSWCGWAFTDMFILHLYWPDSSEKHHAFFQRKDLPAPHSRITKSLTVGKPKQTTRPVEGHSKIRPASLSIFEDPLDLDPFDDEYVTDCVVNSVDPNTSGVCFHQRYLPSKAFFGHFTWWCFVVFLSVCCAGCWVAVDCSDSRLWSVVNECGVCSVLSGFRCRVLSLGSGLIVMVSGSGTVMRGCGVVPGGEWVCVCELSSDGRRYCGVLKEQWRGACPLDGHE